MHENHTELTLIDHVFKDTAQIFPAVDSLSINLDNLLIQLRVQVTPKWYQFGEAVGIQKEVLDNCAKHCPPEECIVEMFDYWLRNCKEQPTWREVAKTLNLINLKELAAEIDRVYTTGIYSSGADLGVG